jgi:uncharacterized membrane protein YeaQ/YmgE (transglycosylase-associated protein family)
MGILSWIIFGALAGWVASLLAGTNERQGCLFNILLGVVGAFLGGFVMQFITGRQFDFDFDLRSFVVAVLGAVIILALTGATRRKRK